MADMPTIGVTSALETVRYFGEWTEAVAMVPTTYLDRIVAAGGRPLLLAPTSADADAPDGLLDLLDGLILTGGAGDVDPGLYGAAGHPATQPVDPLRDRYELALVRAAGERDLPCLGICRGMQVMNVAYGGTLAQHLPESLGHLRHQGEPGTFGEHPVEIEPATTAARALGEGPVRVMSYHHQGVDRVGDGLRVSVRAPMDGTVEGIEDPERAFLLGVQWHPEEDEADRLIAAVVAECRTRQTA